MRKLKWLALNFSFSALMYWALVIENIGAQRILMFVVFLIFMFSLGVFNKDIKKKVLEHGRSVPRFINVGYDLAIVLVFIYFGWWFTGIAYFLALLFHEAAFSGD